MRGQAITGLVLMASDLDDQCGEIKIMGNGCCHIMPYFVAVNWLKKEVKRT